MRPSISLSTCSVSRADTTSLVTPSPRFAQRHPGCRNAAASMSATPMCSARLVGFSGRSERQPLRQGFICLSKKAKSRSKGKKGKKKATNDIAAEVAIENAPAKGPLVVIDNYDSFTYNLCQYLGSLGCEYIVFKNDEKTVEEVRSMNPAGILVSPGPGAPIDSGISLQACRELGPDFPLFGVCMGHQCIGEAFGGKIVRAPTGLMHGKTSPVTHDNTGVLEGLPSPFGAARYHSLVIDEETFPSEELEITARTEDGTIMGVQHRRYPHIQGVQFHPESVITDEGMTIVANFVKVMERGVIDLQA